MQVPVVDARGVPLMPCTPPTARAVLNAGQARPKRNKLGLFYVQLTDEQVPDNQPLVVGIDPGATFEGYSVVGSKDTVCHRLLEAPTPLKQAVETRRRRRRARRQRLWRRPCRSPHRRARASRLPPSTRSRWEANARLVQQLARIMPLTDVAAEEVQATMRPGAGRRWNQAFSPVPVGTAHLDQLLQQQGVTLPGDTGSVTQQLHERYGLSTTRHKAAPTFERSCGGCLGAGGV